jgi:septum site-determining protein MinD
MAVTISVHSSRGGTGKSLISSNLAALYASDGLDVALLDFDFRAPSLLIIFQAEKRVKRWVNEYLDGRAKLRDVMVEMSERYKTRGKLFIGFSDPSVEAMREMARKDRKWQMKALRQVTSLKKELAQELGVDIIIIDTSPGVQYSSVNAVVSADASIVVSSTDVIDIDGAQRMIEELYEPFDKKTYIIVNKATPHMFVSDERRESLLDEMRGVFTEPLIALIPCYCDILLTQRAYLFSLEKPDHPFTSALREVAKRIVET